MPKGPGAAPVRVRFSGFELDLRTGELSHNGHKTRLQEQPLLVLEILLEHPGELVTREELQRRLWPADTFVDFENGLNKAVAKLREALSSEDQPCNFIETLPRRGYRFIAPVEVPSGRAAASGSPSAACLPTESAPDERRSTVGPLRRRRYFRLIMQVAALMLAAALGVFGNYRWRARPAQSSIRSVAVLPLRNLTGDPNQEYLADGLTEELTTDLARSLKLRVISSTSVQRYRDGKTPLPEIARALDVDAVVEGSFSRQGDKVRVTAQLIQARSDRHLWANGYSSDMKDIISLQTRMAENIAEQVSGVLLPEEHREMQRVRSTNADAHLAYIRGEYFFNKATDEAGQKAMESYQDAVRLDSAYAAAYAGIAKCHILGYGFRGETYHQGRVAALAALQKALELDPQLPEAHDSLGELKGNFQYDMPGAEKEFQAALQDNPSFAPGHYYYSHFLMENGRLEESLGEMRKAIELDPLALEMNSDYCRAYVFARQYDAAIAQCKKTLELDEHFSDAHHWLGDAYFFKGDLDNWMAQLMEVDYLTAAQKSELRRIYARAGRPGVESWFLKLVLAANQTRNNSLAAFVAEGYMRTGNKERALLWLDQAFQDRDPYLVVIHTYPAFDPLRQEPRFIALEKKIGFLN